MPSSIKAYIEKTFSGHDFVKNVLFLTSGNFVAQIITVGATPVTTRLFTPDNFGLFALVSSVIMIASNISSLCYERAVLLRTDHLRVASRMQRVYEIHRRYRCCFVPSGEPAGGYGDGARD